jgi:hypothetical protein
MGAGGSFSDNTTLTIDAGGLCAVALVGTDIPNNAAGPVAQGTEFNLIGLVSTAAEQLAPTEAPTGTIEVIDLEQDNTLCSGVAINALAAPNDYIAAGECSGPFNTAANPWNVGLHNLRIQYTPAGNWTPSTFTLPLEITP